jgi:ribose 5-phosphate isomerase A
MVRRKSQPVLRENYKTDNSNLILESHGLSIMDPPALEADLNGIAGVVTDYSRAAVPTCCFWEPRTG